MLTLFCGTVVALCYWMLEEACDQLKIMNDRDLIAELKLCKFQQVVH